MSFLSALTGAATGFLTGGPAGAIAGGIIGASSGSGPRPPAPSTLPSVLGSGIGGAVAGPLGSFVGGALPGLVGAATDFWNSPTFTGGTRLSGRGHVAPVNGRCPSGYHPAKKKGANYCVRNRHMNFGNGRASSRAIRRIRGAEKQYRHIFTILHKKPAGKIMPKHKGR